MYSNLSQRRNNRASKPKQTKPKTSSSGFSSVVQTPQGYKVIPPLQQGVRRSLDESSSSKILNSNTSNPRQPFFISPDTTRTQIVQKTSQKPAIVTGPTPLPPAITTKQRLIAEKAENKSIKTEEESFRLAKKEDILKLSEKQNSAAGAIDRQYFQGAALIPSTKIAIRKFISSLGHGVEDTPYSFNFIFTDSLRSIVKVQFISITMTYVVPIEQPTVGFIYFVNFPTEFPFYYESEKGYRYSATFPVCSARPGRTVGFQYTFPECYILPFSSQTSTINSLDVQLFKEDDTGNFVAFSDIIKCSLEIDFSVAKLAVS